MRKMAINVPAAETLARGAANASETILALLEGDPRLTNFNTPV